MTVRFARGPTARLNGTCFLGAALLLLLSRPAHAEFWAVCTPLPIQARVANAPAVFFGEVVAVERAGPLAGEDPEEAYSLVATVDVLTQLKGSRSATARVYFGSPYVGDHPVRLLTGRRYAFLVEAHGQGWKLTTCDDSALPEARTGVVIDPSTKKQVKLSTLKQLARSAVAATSGPQDLAHSPPRGPTATGSSSSPSGAPGGRR